MNKKQGVIIVTLLVLIVCAGVLATKVNSPLVGLDDNIDGQSTISFNNDEKQKSNDEYFQETKLDRDQQDNETMQTLKQIIDDENILEEDKKTAVEKYTELTIASDNEQRIESILKGKGFEDVICFITDGKARVIIKSSEKLTDKQTRVIQDVVMSVAKLKDVEIEIKQ